MASHQNSATPTMKTNAERRRAFGNDQSVKLRGPLSTCFRTRLISTQVLQLHQMAIDSLLDVLPGMSYRTKTEAAQLTPARWLAARG
jgi:hypothetical protein